MKTAATHIDCIEYCKGKTDARAVQRENQKVSKIGEVIHSNLAGPFQPTTLEKRYMAFFIIKKSRTEKIAILERKSDTTTAFKSFKSNFELQNRVKVLKLHSIKEDNTKD